MSEAENWTVGKLLKWTTDYLAKHGSPSPRLDAEVLLAHTRNCPRIALYTTFDESPPEAQKAAFRDLVKQRAAGAPVAYLVGKREFFSLTFEVNRDVLIPRPETEHLVSAMLDAAKEPPTGSSKQVADLCTGSGIVAICGAKYLPEYQFWAVDLSPEAIDVARRNATNLSQANRINFLLGDLLEPVPEALNFDLIVSNPPYVSEAEYAALEPTVRQYEPRLALVAGETGTEIIERLIQQAWPRLLPGGSLLMETSPMLSERVEGMLTSTQGWELLPTIKDLSGHPRVVRAVKRV